MTASISASPTREVEVDQSIMLRDVSWETYERLLSDAPDRVAPRITFDRGWLQIMSPSRAHEQAKELLSVLVDVVADELGIDVVGAGSTTFRKASLEGGFEPDACFYIANEAIARTPEDPDADLPPDLLIEIDETVSSLDKLPLLARFLVPEVWRSTRAGVSIHVLDGGAYRQTAMSPSLAPLSAAAITRLLDQGRGLPRREWKRLIQQWIRDERESGGGR